jgi:hypothetical protein
MNLILSDVEETIMLVETVDGAPEGQGVVNVRKVFLSPRFSLIDVSPYQGRQTEN